MAVYVQEHVREEHQTLFEKVKASKIDTKALSTTLLARKAELLASIESMKSEIGNQSRVTNPASRAPATRVARVDGGDFTQGGGGL
jgi:hypothetical protein